MVYTGVPWDADLGRGPCSAASSHPRIAALEQSEAWRAAAAESKTMSIAFRWLDIANKYDEFTQNLIREHMVARARRIWGRLGNLLRRAAWPKKWRNANQVPGYVARWVKVWRPK